MKKLLLLLTLSVPFFVNAQDAEKKILTEGTVISVELLQDLSSGTNNVGDIIEFQTNEPVIVGDRVLVPKGTKVTGKVTEAEGRKAMGKGGKLNFTIDWLNMPNGKNVKLTGEQKASGKQKTGAAVAQAVVLTPLFLLKKGKNVKFEKGQIFKVFVDHDTEL